MAATSRARGGFEAHTQGNSRVKFLCFTFEEIYVLSCYGTSFTMMKGFLNLIKVLKMSNLITFAPKMHIKNSTRDKK